MKKLLLIAALAVLSAPVQARNVAIPSDDPAATVTVPDGWKFDESEYGYWAMSRDSNVYFAVESAAKNKIDAMMESNKAWMKENGIDGSVAPTTGEITLGGLPAKVYHFDTKDSNGPTLVEFILVPAGKERLIFLTLWGSDQQRTKHGKEIDAIMTSFKAIQ